MIKRFLGKAETGKLVVSAIALCVDPSGIAATALTLDAAIEARNKFFADHPGLAKLAKEVDADFQKALATSAYDKPDGARELLPQMLAHALSQSDDFVKCGLNAGDILKNLRKRFEASTEKEYQRREIQDAFERAYEPLLTKACNDTGLFAALQPALYREMLETVKATMSNPAQSSSDQLHEAAQFFDDAPGDNATDYELMSFFQNKAEDIARLKNEHETLPPSIPRLANLRAEVDALIEDLRLYEAEELLDGAREIVKQETLRPALEANAILDEQKADILLLRGQVGIAFEILASTAESFSALDQTQMAKKRNHFYGKLRNYSLVFNSSGLKLAIDILLPGIAALEDGKDRLLWAKLKHNLGTALLDFAKITEGMTSFNLAEQAIDTFEDALKVRSHSEHPDEWGMTTHNLGNAFLFKGQHSQGETRLRLFFKSEKFFREAIGVFTKENNPFLWSQARHNHAIVLVEISASKDKNESVRLLNEAINLLNEAISTQIFEDYPTKWAQFLQGLGSALATKGARLGGEEEIELLKQAAETFEKSFSIFTKEKHPIDWANSKKNFASILTKIGGRTPDFRSLLLLAHAEKAYKEAAIVFRREKDPINWAGIKHGLGDTWLLQGILNKSAAGTNMIRKAISAYECALTIRIRSKDPVNWAKIKENTAVAERAQANHTYTEDPAPHLQSALEHVDAALEVFDPEHMSYNHTKATKLREEILADLEALKGG